MRFPGPFVLLPAVLLLCLAASAPAFGPDGQKGPGGRGGQAQDGPSGGQGQGSRDLLEALRGAAPDLFKRHMLQIAGELADLAGNSTTSGDSQKFSDLSYRFATAVNAPEPPSSRTVRGEQSGSGPGGGDRPRGGRRQSGGAGF